FTASTATPLKLGYGSTTIRIGGMSPPSPSLRAGTASCVPTASGIRQTMPSASAAASAVATNISSTDGARPQVIIHRPAVTAIENEAARISVDLQISSTGRATKVDAECATAFQVKSRGKLETKQPIHLHDERAIVQQREATRQRIAFLVVHDEELAAGAVLPPESGVGRNRVQLRVVLQQCADEHQRCHRVGHPRAGQV